MQVMVIVHIFSVYVATNITFFYILDGLSGEADKSTDADPGATASAAEKPSPLSSSGSPIIHDPLSGDSDSGAVSPQEKSYPMIRKSLRALDASTSSSETSEEGSGPASPLRSTQRFRKLPSQEAEEISDESETDSTADVGRRYVHSEIQFKTTADLVEIQKESCD